MMYTKDEIQAVKYYIGDVRNMPSDGFWNDPKAYCLLNALFFPGIATESARIAEGKFLNPEILSDIPRLKAFFRNLCSAFRKSEQEHLTYRVERYADFQQMYQQKQTISFTSTSKNGFLSAYQDRIGIALLKFRIPENTPIIDMQSFFQNYAKPEEAEILLPPGRKLQFEVSPLSDAEKTILDAENHPPLISCTVTVQNQADFPEIREFPDSGNLAGIRVINALQNGSVPENQDILNYSAWKSALSVEILHWFS